jgi:uncharacterized protein
MWNWIAHHGKRAARITAGFFLLLVGVIFGFLPVLQGWPFVLAGLAILSVDFVWAHKLKTKIRDTAGKVVDKVRGQKPD